MKHEFTRAEELNVLYDKVMARENIFLFGDTGIGKTHLVHQLKNKLEGRRVCFYRSLRGIITIQQYLQEMTKMMRAMAANHSNLDYQLKRFLDENPIYLFETLEQLNPWIEKLAQTLNQIGLDFLFVYEDLHEWEDEETLDSLFQHFSILDRTSNCQLFVSGNQNYSAKIEGLTFFPYSLEAIDIDKIWLAPIDDWKTKAYQFSNGNTAFLIDILAYCEKFDNDIDLASRQLMYDHHPSLEKFRRRFTKLQWRLLRSIAFEEVVEQPHAFQFLVKHKLGAASSVERALRNLNDTQMVVKKENGWHMSSIVQQRWLQWLYARN